MSDNINKMDFKQLRNEVQLLRDELAIMKRKYEDIIYNLDTDNFSSRFVKEQGDMRTAIEVTAEGVKSKVSKEDFESTITQTAESISSIVSEFVDVSQAVEVNSTDEFSDKSKIYVIREKDNGGNLITETFYHYNTISGDWKPISADGIIYSLFEQRDDGFYLKGDVKVEGSCILTDSLTFDSSDNPLQVEYSANGTSGWHTTFVSGSDKFMRLKIGASWSDAMKIVGSDGSNGSNATVTPQKVFDVLTDGGTTQGLFTAFYDGGDKLFINAEYIKAGMISASRIETEGLSCTRLYAKDNYNGYFAKLNGNLGDFGIFNSMATDYTASNSPYCMFGVYNSFPNVNLFIYGNNFMGYDVDTDTIWAKGNWDFSVANVKGL